MIKYLRYLVLFLLLSCTDHIEDNSQYSYKLSPVPDGVCSLISGETYSIKVDTSQLQTFTKFQIYTNNSNSKYINWKWSANDTVYTIISGANYGPMIPTNPSSTLLDGNGSAMFGFHKLMVGDTVRIRGFFIDSKILTNVFSERDITFIIKMK